MTIEEQAAAATDEVLVQMWKNAYVTWCRCGGHLKAQRNEYFKNVHQAEMTKRGLTIPYDNVADGVFNGIGAF